ncbi:MAG: esterase, partial [Bacteroidetes bacterium]|nr:esterase [Bacteroidota bacterium]
MSIDADTKIRQETLVLESVNLARTVRADIYIMGELSGDTSLLLLNDGQDLVRMGFAGLFGGVDLEPLLCVGIHAGEQRMMEYGVSGRP